MKSNSELRSEASSALTGNWLMAAVMTLVYIVVLQAPSLPASFVHTVWSSTSSILVILLLPLSWGYMNAFLATVRGEKLDFSSLFDGFKEYGKVLGTMLLLSLYTFLWALLLVIPGIVKSYSYAMTYFIMRDNPSLCYNEAIEKSMAMMQGNKMKLFLLDVSFIGWLLLSFLTLGIGFLFLNPYVVAAHAAFYEDLKHGQDESIEIISE